MKVYTFWESSENAPDRQAEFFRMWERSWSRHGWETRLLTDFNVTCNTTDTLAKVLSALAAVGGGYYSSPRIFNGGFNPARPKSPVIKSDLRPWDLFYLNRDAARAFNLGRSTPTKKHVVLGPEILAPWSGPEYKDAAKCWYFESYESAVESGLCL